MRIVSGFTPFTFDKTTELINSIENVFPEHLQGISSLSVKSKIQKS